LLLRLPNSESCAFYAKGRRYLPRTKTNQCVGVRVLKSSLNA